MKHDFTLFMQDIVYILYVGRVRTVKSFLASLNVWVNFYLVWCTVQSLMLMRQNLHNMLSANNKQQQNNYTNPNSFLPRIDYSWGTLRVM